MKHLIAIVGLALLTAPAFATQPAEPEVWARLPEPVTNNAVAGVELEGRLMAYSFAGLHEGKTWRDVTADAYACDLEARECREIGGLPDGVGRLASVAVTVRDEIYIFGGYTVAEDGAERSTPEVWRFDPASETYTHITDIPVPVDDTVALPFGDRYIYLVSGWHDTDNVDLVQVYDVEEDRWFEATPFPGAPVFGHAGAVHPDGRLLICGGTAVIPPPSPGQRRGFAATDHCWSGQIHADLTSIEWLASSPIPGGPFYRGTAYSALDLTVFVGGTDNAFNFNGVGYDGVPSEPRSDHVSFRPAFAPEAIQCPQGYIPWVPVAQEARWRQRDTAAPEVMDVRGIIVGRSHGSYLVGGMGPQQRVLDTIYRLPTISGLIDPVSVCLDPHTPRIDN